MNALEPGQTPLSDARTLRVIPWIVAIAFFMQMLDSSILNTALPAIAADFRRDPLSLHWVVIAYVLTVAVLMLVSGWIADRFGTRRVLVYAIGLFTLGSLLCAVSVSLPMLVLSRVIQGMGGAFLMPVGRLVILRLYPRQQLIQVLSFVSIPGLIGPLLGPSVGGFLAQFTSWHWIFLINLPVGLLGGLAVWRYIPDMKAPASSSFDGSGFLLFGAAMILLSFAVDNAGAPGRPWWHLAGPTGAGTLCLLLYVLHARHHPRPLFRLQIFRIRNFSVGILGNIFSRLANGGMPFLTPLLLQVVMGYSPFYAGLIMIPLTVAAVFSKAMAATLLDRLGCRTVLVVNTMLLGLCIASFALLSSRTPLPIILLVFFLFGAVNSLQFTAMNVVTLIDLPGEDTSEGNSLLSVVMQLFLSMGVAVAAALLALFTPEQSAAGAGMLPAFRFTYFCTGGLAMLSSVIFFFLASDTEKARSQSGSAG